MKTTKEKSAEAEVFVTKLYCIEDNIAMEYTERTFPTHPPKFEYQCPICKKKEITTVRYPYVTYREKK